MSFLEQYYVYTNEYTEKYGSQTIVLMQCGAFFEVYGKKDDKGNITGSRILEYSQLTELKRVYKCPGNIMAGFRDYDIERYIKKLQDNGYTVVVFEEYDVADDGTKLRRLQGIYSPGTYIYEDDDQLSNNIMCIWLEEKKSKIQNKMIIALTNIDVITGKITMFENIVENSHLPTTYDDLERLNSIYNPNEIILISNMPIEKMNEVISFADLQPKLIHKIQSEKNKFCEKCASQNYQEEIFNKIFNHTICQSLFQDQGHNVYALSTLVYILQFIWEHSPFLVEKLREPEFESPLFKVILANHSLKQLNIINNNARGKCSSIMSLLDNNVSSIGKRRFRRKLQKPSFDIDFLEKEYTTGSYIEKNREIFIKWRKDLYDLKDLEKMYRFIISEKIHPQSLSMLYNNVILIKEIYIEIFNNHNLLLNYLNIYNGQDICNDLTEILENIYILEVCNNMNSSIDYSIRFIKKEQNEELDNIEENLIKNQNDLLEIIHFLNNLLINVEKKASKRNNKQVEFIKFHETEKGNISLHITKRRSNLLKNELTNCSRDDLKSIIFVNATNSCVSIECEKINSLCNSITYYKKQFQNKQEEVFKEKILLLKEKKIEFEKLIHIIGCIDNWQNFSYLINKFKLTCPIIDHNSNVSFFNAEGLYHPLIQALQENELYVENDINLGINPQGILLYGTNAVGKSSLIKAIGISLIMAQSGLFVPCKSLTYFPYQRIMTRILSNDNLFKGLSTFAVEMIELRNILKCANNKSLILGDELCSGTEIDSAKSIFVAGLKWLYDRNCSFIFATHLHDIVNYSEIENMKNLHLKHLSVIYDESKKVLIYDRKLRENSGPSIYGLEVCKSLNLPYDFLEHAIQLRNKYSYDKNIIDLSNSHFNSKKILGLCEVCKKTKACHIHHLMHQKNSDENGFIGKNHKNHYGNLLAVCEKCHSNFHNEENSEFVKKKTLNGSMILEKV